MKRRGLPSARAAAGPVFLLLFFVLYALTRDRIYAFDSLLYASAAERPPASWPFSSLLTWNHFVWLPAVRSFFLVLKSAGYQGGAYEALQLWNAAAGALLAGGLFSFLSSRIHFYWAALAACLAGASHTVWLRATGGEPYLTGTLLAAAACVLIMEYRAGRGRAFFFGAALLCGAAANFHIANLILLPLGALAVAARRSPGGRAADAVLFLSAAGALLLPYALLYGLFSPAGFLEWLAWGSGQVNGQLPGASVSGQFVLDPLKSLSAGALALFRSVFPLPAGELYAAAAVPAAAAAGFAVLRVWRRLDADGAWPALVFLAGNVLFFSVWQPGNLIYWAGPAVFLILSLAMLAAPFLREPPGRAAGRLLAAGVIAAGLLNFHAAVRPGMVGVEAKPMLALCAAIREATPPGSAVLISGLREGMLKVGIPYFARRRTLSLDLFVIQNYGSGRDPLAALASVLDRHLASGGEVYVMDDVLSMGDGLAPWGVTVTSLNDLLGGYRLTEAARLPGERPSSLYRLETDEVRRPRR